jgi:hypothetical protein
VIPVEITQPKIPDQHRNHSRFKPEEGKQNTYAKREMEKQLHVAPTIFAIIHRRQTEQLRLTSVDSVASDARFFFRLLPFVTLRFLQQLCAKPMKNHESMRIS